jgi:hypothetical protein
MATLEEVQKEKRERLMNAKRVIEESGSASGPTAAPVGRGNLVIDTKTGDRVIRVRDFAKTVKGDATVLSLWDILEGGTTITSMDGEKAIRIKPLTLGTLARLEEFQASYEAKPGQSLTRLIKILTIMLNDPNQSTGRPSQVSESEVGEMLDGEMFPIALKVIEEMSRPLTEAAGPPTATDGTGSSSSLPANTSSARGTLPA